MAAAERSFARRRSRGAAMVEAAVAIPTLILLFAGLIFIWQLYREKGRVTADARLRAWAYAESNCGVRGDPGVDDEGPGASGDGVAHGSLDNGNNGDMANNPVDLSEAQNDTKGAGSAAHTDTLSKDLGTASVTAGGSVAADGVLGGFTSPVAARRAVVCNEPPYNASLKNLLPAAFHAITPW